MRDLFSHKENIIIKKITLSDVDFQSDHLVNLKELILSNEAKYPNIDLWYNNKVIPGIKDSQRSAYIGYFNNKPLISAIVKKDNDAKICHLKIGEDLQDYGIGDIFFSLMIFDVVHCADNVHFTLPEGLWESKSEFFKSFGFNSVKKSKIQYRKGEDELLCSSRIKYVYRCILSEKLPKLFFHYSIGGYTNDVRLILSIHPKYADMIFSGEKKVELRRSFSTKWIGSKAAIYSTYPSREIKGYVTLKNIINDIPEVIWAKYGDKIGIEYTEFIKYTRNKKRIYAIELDEIKKYLFGIPITQLEGLLKRKLVVPQSFRSTSTRDVWYKGISIATLLHSMHSDTELGYSNLIDQLNKVLKNKDIISI